MYLGDYREDDALFFSFTTRAFATGAPTQLAGSPVLSVYKDADDTQSTTGITLAVDDDSITGWNRVTIDTSDAFYTVATDFMVVITTGTVGGVSVVGEVVAHFSIENRSALRPTTPNRELNVSAGGVGDADMTAISTDATAADNLETMLDGTGGQTLSLGKLAVVSLSGDAVTMTGQGAGEGLKITAGATGNGVEIVGGSTSGDAMRVGTAGSGLAMNIFATANDGIDITAGANFDGVSINTAGNGGGIYVAGKGAGAAITIEGGATGDGVLIVGGATSGHGINVSAGGDGDGIRAIGTGAGTPLNTATTDQIADAVADEAYDGATTLRQSIRLANSANASKLSGAATTTVVIRDLADTKDRITATVDANGNRTAVTTDVT